MAQDLNGGHQVAEISRVAAVYGTGHILSGKMDKNRDNGELVSVGDYNEGEYYTVAPFTGTLSAKVVEVVENSNRTMVRIELQSDCDAYFVDNPETMANDYLKQYQEEECYYNAKDEIVRMYPMVKHDVFSISKDAFTGTGTIAVGATVSWSSEAYAFVNA